MSKSKSHQPLYAFSIPPTLLSDFQPRELHIPESHPLHPSQQQLKSSTPPVPDFPAHLAIEDGRAPGTPGARDGFYCALTNATFPDLVSLREHYKTDWYKFNVKLRLQGKPTGVSEEQFTKMVDALTDSISGSDTASSDDDDDSANAVSRLLRKQKLDPASRAATAQANPDSDEDDATPLTGPRSALLWFEAPNANPGTQYGVYRASLPTTGRNKSGASDADVLDELRRAQLPPLLTEGGKEAKGPEIDQARAERKWTLLMFGGGHFAGMVISLCPRMVSKGKGKEREREPVVVVSKTFHRYTTRRKQGGSQSANDNANGKAKSMGAQLRRANEMALREEVQELLASWKDEIDGCEAIFLRTSKTNYKPFFDYDGAALKRDDPRIRGFSFPTKRPTLNELLRAFDELTKVKASHLTQDALNQMDADYLKSIAPRPKPVAAPPKPAAPKPAVIRMSKEEELERDRWERLVEMVRKGRVENVATFLDKYGPELEQAGAWGKLPGWMEEARTTPTLLHVASAADQAEMVTWLLVEKRADPTLEASAIPGTATEQPQPTEGRLAITANDFATPQSSSGPAFARTPYELAPSRLTRNVFRALVTSNPDWWDWTGSGPTGARVPSGLDEEKEAEKESKAKDRRAKLRQQLKERDAARDKAAAEEREREAKEKAEREAREAAELVRTRGNKVVSSGPQRLGGAPPQGFLNRQQAQVGEGLTEQQRMRIMREQRARAAEARLGGGGAK